MSLLSRPTVVFAIVVGCFAVLIPRVFLPFFRSKPTTSSQHFDEQFRRPFPAHMRSEHGDQVEHVAGTPPHMRGAHPGMRMHHPGAHARAQGAVEQTSSSKSIVTLALPMYTVGIGVFFVYTCCKYWSKKNTDEKKSKKKSRWINADGKINYDLLEEDSEEEGNKEELYAGLDAEYVEYLKMKKQKALEAERAMTDEQKQMHHALEEMKKSLSFISSKLVTKESRGNLNTTEIDRLQERLATTEAQMCKILSALDAASEKVNDLTKKPTKIPIVEEDSCESEDKCSSDDERILAEDDSDDEDPPIVIHRTRRSSSSSSSSLSNDEDQLAPSNHQKTD